MSKRISPRRAALIRAGILLARMDATAFFVGRRQFPVEGVTRGMKRVTAFVFATELTKIYNQFIESVDRGAS